MKNALITGIGGQDGSYLTELLLDKGYRVVGTVPDGDPVNIDRIRHLLDRIEIVQDDLLDQDRIEKIFRDHRPDEVYNFAANSVLAASFHQPILATMVLAMGVTRVLEAIRKITPAAAKIKLGLEKELRLGNLDARRDWGFAGDYVRAMWLMLQQPRPDDYVLATGETRSVRDLCEEAFSHLGLEYREYVVQEAESFRPPETAQLVGNPAKARGVLGWKREVSFRDLVRRMVDADLEALRTK